MVCSSVLILAVQVATVTACISKLLVRPVAVWNQEVLRRHIQHQPRPLRVLHSRNIQHQIVMVIANAPQARGATIMVIIALSPAVLLALLISNLLARLANVKHLHRHHPPHVLRPPKVSHQTMMVIVNAPQTSIVTAMATIVLGEAGQANGISNLLARLVAVSLLAEEEEEEEAQEVEEVRLVLGNVRVSRRIQRQTAEAIVVAQLENYAILMAQSNALQPRVL